MSRTPHVRKRSSAAREGRLRSAVCPAARARDRKHSARDASGHPPRADGSGNLAPRPASASADVNSGSHAVVNAPNAEPASVADGWVLSSRRRRRVAPRRTQGVPTPHERGSASSSHAGSSRPRVAGCARSGCHERDPRGDCHVWDRTQLVASARLMRCSRSRPESCDRGHEWARWRASRRPGRADRPAAGWRRSLERSPSATPATHPRSQPRNWPESVIRGGISRTPKPQKSG